MARMHNGSIFEHETIKERVVHYDGYSASILPRSGRERKYKPSAASRGRIERLLNSTDEIECLGCWLYVIPDNFHMQAA